MFFVLNKLTIIKIITAALFAKYSQLNRMEVNEGMSEDRLIL